MSLSIGKRRGLAQCSTPRGTFAILALDHRNNLRRAFNSKTPDLVSYGTLAGFKQDVVGALAPYCSAVLLDPEIGSAPIIAEDALPGKVGLLVAVESTGYTAQPTDRVSEVLPGWSVGKIKRMGGSAVKLLVYYHPEAEHAREQEDLVNLVAEECHRYDLPLFLEPLSFSLDPQKKKLAPSELQQVVIETARRLTPLGIDILKAEFPVDVAAIEDEQEWSLACSVLTEASSVPWALLSAGVDYETFLRQVTVACRAGATGVLAGRAVWSEAVELQGSERLRFLRSTATERMSRLSALCDALGKPWKEAYPANGVGEDWYREYHEI
jgi:tagatose 1,6-diphosphate aldolase